MAFEELAQAMGDLDEYKVDKILRQVMEDGGSRAAEAMEACQRGMDKVGELFQAGDYFVGDLIYAGELMTKAVSVLRDALLSEQDAKARTKVILCTVKDDLHDIGKNIVRSMLEAGGFDVVDLGIDVPADDIVQTAIDRDIRIIALSGVLKIALDSMKDTVEAFKDAGIRDKVKIIIGGAPVNEEALAWIGADAYAHDPEKTVRICSDWAAQMR